MKQPPLRVLKCTRNGRVEITNSGRLLFYRYAFYALNGGKIVKARKLFHAYPPIVDIKKTRSN